MPRVQEWHVYDGSNSGGLVTVASGTPSGLARVAEPDVWRLFTEAMRPRIVREVASDRYLLTQARETDMDDHEPAEVHGGAKDGRELLVSPELIVAASRIAVRRALAIQRALGVAAVSMENGRIVMIPAEELPRDVNDVEWTERQLARQARSRQATDAHKARE